MAGPWEEFSSSSSESTGPWSDFQGQESAPKKSSLARRVLGDTGVSLLKGAVAVPEAAVGLGNIVSGGLAGKYAEQAGFRPKEAKAALDEMYSPEQKAANQYVQEGDGFVDTFKRAIERPSVIGQSVAESLPLLLPGAAAARGIGAATKVAPYIAGAAGEGLVGAGSAAEQLRQGSEDGTISGKQTLGALASGVGTAGFGALGGKVASSAIGKKLGISDIDTVLAGGASNPASVGLAKRALSGAVSEGVLEELPQSMWEQAAQNYATDKPLGEGVGQAGAMGLLAGTAMGGTFNAMQRGEQRKAVDDTKPVAEEVAPVADGLTFQPGLIPGVDVGEPKQATIPASDMPVVDFQKSPVYGPAAPVSRADGMPGIDFAPEPKLQETGPMSSAVNVGVDSGATSLRPQGSFSNMSEFANLLGEEQQDVQSRRTGIAGRQALQREVALRDADQRVADQMAKEAAQRRRAVLDQVLSDPTTQNPADRFAAELQRQGFRDLTPTADELATVQRFNDIKAAEPAGPEIEPSLPNELDAEQLGIKPKQSAKSGSAPQARDKVAEVRQLVADGWKISNKTLVSPTGKKRILNTAEHAAAKEATRDRNLAAMERYRQSKGKGTPVSTTNAASEETNAPEIKQLAPQAAQANDAQVEPQPSAAPQAEGVTQPEPAEATPAVAQSDVEDYGKRVVRRKKGNEARDDLVGAIMRVTGGNGVAASMSQTITGDTANRASKVRGLFTNNGTMDLDDIANDLRTEEGYDVRDGNHLAELIREQAAGNPVYSMERNERDAAANEEKKQKDAVLKQANELGLKGVGGKRTLAVVEAEIAKVEAERNELEKRQERAAIQAEAIAEKLDSDGLDLTEADLMSWLGSIVEYTQDDINEANSRASEIASRRAETNAIVDSEGQAQSSGGERAENGSTQEGARSTEGITYKEGKGLAKGKWFAVSNGEMSNAADTKEQAAESLQKILSAKQANEYRRVALDDLARSVANKIKNGTQPTDKELYDLFGLEKKNDYVYQEAVGAFLVKHLGVSRNRIHEALGKAGGIRRSDFGGERKIAYPRKLHEVFGAGFDLTKQTNKQAAEQFAQQNAPESDQVSKEQADRERDAVPFSMQQQSQPKPQGRQTGLFTADGRVSSEAKQTEQTKAEDEERFEREMRANSSPTKSADDDVQTSSLRYVSFAKALEIAKNAVASGVKPLPAQFHSRLDLTMSSADRLIAAVKEQTKETDKGVAMFSRDDVNASRGQGSGMAFRDLQAVVDRVSKGFNNLPKIHVLDSPRDLSDRRDNERTLKEQIEQAGAMDDVEGAHHNGEIYLFASGIASEERAEHVLATHEITHYGLRGTMGKGLDSALQNIWLYNKEVRAKAAVLRMQLGLTSNVSAVEEVLAEMKDSDLVKLKGWRKMVQAFRDWAHKAGFERIAAKLDGLITKGMSDQEKADLFVANMVNAARDWVRNGKPARGYDPGTSMLGDANFSAKNDTINVDGVDRPTVNSNGKPIAQTKEGLRNFWRWFGDSWAVDADGKPLVMYHGTAGNFNAFDPNKVGSNYKQDKKGFFLAANPKEAGWVADDASEKGGSANIMPLYAQINNPLEITVPQGKGFSASAYFDNSNKKEILTLAKKEKRDGVIVRGRGDDLMFIAFKPEQIKSATGNNGNFDASNPDIRFSRNKSASVDASITEIFDGLAGRGLKKVRAEERLAEHPQAESIRYVQDNILDILEELEGAGTIKINC